MHGGIVLDFYATITLTFERIYLVHNKAWFTLAMQDNAEYDTALTQDIERVLFLASDICILRSCTH